MWVTVKERAPIIDCILVNLNALLRHVSKIVNTDDLDFENKQIDSIVIRLSFVQEMVSNLR